jgi:glycosyltransferase involved in cell wall biosynthesis
VAQTTAALSYFPPAAGRIDRAIPNPVLPPRGSGKALVPRTDPVVLAMGRLGPEKGFDRLLEAFARLAPAFPDWRLEIWGEGSERPALEASRRRLRLEDRVTLPGLTNVPGDVMRQSSLFVLSSSFEGFPNVLGEALACGLPAVSFDCPNGPAEIVRHGIDGLLVPPAGGVAALAEALGRLMGDPEERRRFAARTPEVLERFDVDRVISLWEGLLADLGLPVERTGAHPRESWLSHG